jgi:hypothetical protein
MTGESRRGDSFESPIFEISIRSSQCVDALLWAPLHRFPSVLTLLKVSGMQ